MKTIRKNPHIYEINLITWLHSLSRREQRNITLSTIPEWEWVRLREMGIDFIWLMGIWQRSPYSETRAGNEPFLLEECRSILEDFDMDDIAGSPYAVYDYCPDPAFGSPDDLLDLKTRLEDKGLFLILDFVPNHTACDHPWVNKNPGWYVQEDSQAGEDCGKGFFRTGNAPGRPCIAHGKDPYFAPWTDTAQLNYANPECVSTIIQTISDISGYCHGLRCDMAMLVLRDVFQKTWGRHLKKGIHAREFWPLAVNRINSEDKQYLFLAEAYWGMEPQLLNQGFDYTYDKTLYDLLTKEDIQGLRDYLSMPVTRQEKMIRFLENHDEPRAYQVFGPEKIRCVMVIHATLPGMRFWQRGQFEGRQVRVPVQLRHGPVESDREDIETFSGLLLQEVNQPVFHDGSWEMCNTSGWPDNQSHKNLLAWCWSLNRERRLIVINFSSSPAQGHVRLPTNWLSHGERFLCHDPIMGEGFLHSKAESESSGIYVGLESYGFHFFRIEGNEQ